MKNKEYILCSAVWVKDGKKYKDQPTNIDSGFVVCGRRHNNCFVTLELLKLDRELLCNKFIIQGFVTNLDRFCDRVEAGKIAFEAKQINKLTKCLLSEDLW